MRSTEEKIKRKVISVVIIVAILSTMAGCGKSQKPQRTNHIDYLACIWRTDRFSVK